MGSYSGNLGQPDRTKAVAAVAIVHAAIALIILTGLNVPVVRSAVEHMTTITIVEPPVPPPLVPPPAPIPDRARMEQGAPAKRARPTEVVAPKSPIPEPSPIIAAPVAATGAAASSGAAAAGNGTGAGGAGTGPGGGGYGDTSRFTPARLVHNLSRRDYASIAGDQNSGGSADMAISITPDGRVGDCRTIRSSGNAGVDRRVCQLVIQRLRFRPALDDSGRPIVYRTNYHASWQLGY